MARFRPLAIVSGVFTFIAFILVLVTLLAGSKKGLLEDMPILTLNVSRIGSNIVVIEPANSTTSSTSSSSAAAAVAVATATSSSSSSSGGGLIPSVTLPFESLLPSVSNPLSAILPTGTNDPLSGLGSGLTSTIDNGLDSAINDIAEGVVKALGVQDWYSFYVTDTCVGSYTPSATAANAKKNTSLCGPTSKAFNIINTNIPSYLVVAGTNISVPAIEILTSSMHDIENEVKDIFTALFVLFLISIISFGIVVLLSGILFFIPTAPLPHNKGEKLIFYTALTFSQIGTQIHLITSIAFTSVVGALKSELKNLSTIGLVIDTGSKFLAITWVATVSAYIGSFYFLWVYWTEFRTWTLARRVLPGSSEKEERGGWGGRPGITAPTPGTGPTAGTGEARVGGMI